MSIRHKRTGYSGDKTEETLLREGRRHWEDCLTAETDAGKLKGLMGYRAICEAAEALRLDTADRFGDRIRGAE